MKIGFINGCFDVLHVGHINILKFAKMNCDYLIVAIDSDDRIKKSKGSDRPFNKRDDRIEFLKSIRYVDEVLTFNTDQDLENILEKIKPDVMIEGEEYRNKKVIGSRFAKELKYFRRIDGYSTTKILESSTSR